MAAEAHQVAEGADAFARYRQRMALVVTQEGFEHGLGFRPEPTDVVISPFAKSGTTWLQQIVHGLRTRGDMDFDDISRVVPWIETAHDLGIDLEAEQKARPRAFKSHLPWDPIPKGCRYIVSFRDPKDVLVSFYRFMEGWFFEPGSISIDELARRQYLDRSEQRDYWSHFVSWWGQRDNESVLLLTFEEMKQDPAPVVERIAAFLDIELDPELLALVVEQSSLPFMLAHKNRFDDLLMRERSVAVAGVSPGSDSAKVRTGKVGEHTSELPLQLIDELDAMWQSAVAEPLGLDSYPRVLETLRG